MRKGHIVWFMAVCLGLTAAAAWGQATPADAVSQAVAESGVFPAGTSVVSVTVDGASAVVDLTAEAAVGLTDTQSDAMVQAIIDALGAWPEITAIEVTAAGRPLWQYLPPATAGGVAPRMRAMAAPMAAPLTTELAGKMVALHPSHGSYWHQGYGYWFRAMRTLCGPNPQTNLPPGWTGSVYQPSDYYFWTRGYQWGSFYEDDMSPETIRFLKAYCESSGAEVWVSRNLDKNAGDFPVPYNGKYPNCSFPLPKWQTAAKYYLEDRGDIPEWVWNEPTLTAESDKDIRARPYYANYRMTQGGYAWQDCVSLHLHSNAAGAGTARGTEIYWYTAKYPYLETAAKAFCTAVEAKVINAIKNEYDGFWAEAMYPVGPNPPEWPSGTYRGYDHDGPSTPSTTSGWQDRGVKTSNYGEIREAMVPAGLMEIAFHDDWKFYPDHVFLMDQIWRSTVSWGMYEGICQYFGVTAKPRLAASVVAVDFPANVILPGEAFTATVTVQNLGQAWCWGHKFIPTPPAPNSGGTYVPYTVWKLAAVGATNPFDGTKVAIDAADVIMPGDTKTFTLQLTAPAICGMYDVGFQMLKDDARGGAFGDVASATLKVGSRPDLDILPADCPNSFEPNKLSKGRIPMAILGSADFDVTAIDVNSISIGGVVFPVKAPTVQDVSGPGADCGTGLPDGYPDLVVHFSRRDLIDALGLDLMEIGTRAEVTVTGLASSCPFEATDSVVIAGVGD